jgi:hypothetical protein
MRFPSSTSRSQPDHQNPDREIDDVNAGDQPIETEKQLGSRLRQGELGTPLA